MANEVFTLIPADKLPAKFPANSTVVQFGSDEALLLIVPSDKANEVPAFGEKRKRETLGILDGQSLIVDYTNGHKFSQVEQAYTQYAITNPLLLANLPTLIGFMGKARQRMNESSVDYGQFVAMEIAESGEVTLRFNPANLPDTTRVLFDKNSRQYRVTASTISIAEAKAESAENGASNGATKRK